MTGLVQRVNMFPNPRFNPEGYRYGAWGTDYAKCMSDGVLSMSPSLNDGSFVEIAVKGLTAGEEYVFSVKPVGGTTGISLSFWTKHDGENADYWAELVGDRFVGRMIASGDKIERLVFNHGQWTEPLIELASTYDAAVSGGGFGSSPGTPCRDRNGIRRAGGAR